MQALGFHYFSYMLRIIDLLGKFDPIYCRTKQKIQIRAFGDGNFSRSDKESVVVTCHWTSPLRPLRNCCARQCS